LERLPRVGFSYPLADELINPIKGEETLPRNLVDLRHAVIHTLARSGEEIGGTKRRGLMIYFERWLGEERIMVLASVTREEIEATKESMRVGKWNDPNQKLDFSILIGYADEQGWVMVADLDAELLDSQIVFWENGGGETEKNLLECSSFLTQKIHDLVILA